MGSTYTKKNDKKISSSELAYQKIKEKILLGAISPGQQLREAYLSQELGLTRTPIREALKRLEAEDLVQMFPNRGAFVSQFSLEEVIDILDTREALECKAVHLACRRANREELDRIRDSLEQMKTKLRSEVNVSIYLEFDFHYKILNLSKNKFLISAWEMLKNRLDLTRLKSAFSKDRALKAVFEHIDILEFIYKGESEQAQRKIIEHMVEVKMNLNTLEEAE